MTFLKDILFISEGENLLIYVSGKVCSKSNIFLLLFKDVYLQLDSKVHAQTKPVT